MVIVELKNFKFKSLKDQNLKNAAKKIKRDIDKHFKKDGWDLDYNFQVDEVFFEAYRESLSAYLIDALSTKTGKYCIKATKKGLVISLSKK